MFLPHKLIWIQAKLKHSAISSADHLCELCNECFRLTDVKIHRCKCTVVLLPHFQDELRTDISVFKQLALCIVYYSQNTKRVVSTFLESGDAESIVKLIKSAVNNFGFDLNKNDWSGNWQYKCDGGCKQWCFKKLKQDINHLVLMRCVCHSVQLAVSAATAETLPRNV